MPGSKVLQGRLARAHRTLKQTGSADDARRVRELTRDYYAQHLAEHIAAVVAKAPPLTDAQVAGLRSLLAEASGRRG